MQDDFRFIHREESFEDLAVRELAKSRSACMCRLQFGRCTKEECSTCEVNKRYYRCFKQMSDYDKQRLQSYTARLWAERSADPMQWSSFNGCIKQLGLYLLVGTLCVAMVLGLMALASCPGAEPDRVQLSVEMDERIIAVMKGTHSQVRDLNHDGKVNCIDYTCMFKQLWDRKYPDRKDACTIVRNYNPRTGFHHLFIRIYDAGTLVYVEPRASNPYRYTMEENWTDGRYNPRYDIMGETRKWMVLADEIF